MTICIAAVCDDGKHIVVAADQMFTVGPPLNVEFQPPLSKIEPMGTTCVALGAGNSLYADEILQRARSSYQNAPGTRVPQIATAVNNVYATFRNEKIEEQIIIPALGADFLGFRARSGTLPAYLQVQPGMYQNMVVQATQYNLGVEVIIAGIDTEGSHLYYVGHPGSLTVFNKVGYTVIGSGATHAAIKFALGLQHPKASVPDTLLSVYAAKRSAEVAPGVGPETEMRVLSQTAIWPVSNKLISKLKAIHDAEQKAKPNVEEVEKLYVELRKDG